MRAMGFSTGGVGHEGNTDRMVKAILHKSGLEYEFVKLTDLSYSGCKGCVQLCSGPQVCQLQDDLFSYYKKIKEADVVVIGSPVYSGNINTAALSFIERFYGYRHVEATIKGKPFIQVITGLGSVDTAVEGFNKALRGSRGRILDTVVFKSRIPPCYRCGRHQKCRIGAAFRIWGEDVCTLEITPELLRRWEDHPEAVAAVERAASRLKALASEPLAAAGVTGEVRR